jgi:bifunctional non-homologous end joining protein LigD
MRKKASRLSSEVKLLLKKGTRAPLPQNIEPMLATLAGAPLAGEEWLYEMKWDGYRALAYLSDGNVEISSRNNKSFNKKFYPLHQTLSQWKINAVVDVEIVVLNQQCIPYFS